MPVFSVFNALFSELWQTSSNARNLIDFFFLFRITHLELVRLNVGVGDDFFFLHFASRQLGFSGANHRPCVPALERFVVEWLPFATDSRMSEFSVSDLIEGPRVWFLGREWYAPGHASELKPLVV